VKKPILPDGLFCVCRDENRRMRRAALSGRRLLLPDTVPANLILPVIAASSVAKQHPKLP
ncbi:TPA: hypothetical protein ACQ5AA_004946, partial [Citrobacter braakii]